MYSTYQFQLLAFALLVLGQLVFAGPGGFVTLINATPYDWKLTAIHQYQMDWKFPSVIPAGSSHEQYIKYIFNHGDDAAEATYTLVDNPSPASFTIQARQKNKRIQIQYHDTLSSLNNPVNSLINLGFVHDGAVSFILSGNGTDSPFISTNPPVAWMQSTFATIGSKPVREIAMPASHDAGISEITGFYGGVPHNTQTQSTHIYQQLVSGARFLDIRPVYRRGSFFTGHFSKVLGTQCGGLGRSLANVVSDINRFAAENPGELIILDISHDMNMDMNYGEFAPQMWLKLFEVLRDINRLWVPPNSLLPEDLSSLPLSTFITPGSESAVLIRIPDSAPLPGPSVALRAVFERAEEADATQSTDDMDATEALPTLSIINVDDDSPTANTTTSSEQSPTASKVPSALPRLTRTTPVLPKSRPYSTTPKKHLFYTTAFVPESRLPTTGSYSETDSPSYLSNDQLSKLSSFRPSPQAVPLRSTWTITQRWQHVLDVATPRTSIIGDAIAAHRALFATLWPALSKTTYPNIIEIDNFSNSQLTALAMAINECFASRSRPSTSSRQRRAILQHPHIISSSLTKESAMLQPQTQAPKPSATTTTLIKRNFWDVLRCVIYAGCEIKDQDVYGLHHIGENPPPPIEKTDCLELNILKMPQYCWNLLTPEEKWAYSDYLVQEIDKDRLEKEKQRMQAEGDRLQKEEKERKKAEKKENDRLEKEERERLKAEKDRLQKERMRAAQKEMDRLENENKLRMQAEMPKRDQLKKDRRRNRRR